MTEDLEKTLDELGPEYRALVARLKAAPCPWADEAKRPPRRARSGKVLVGLLPFRSPRSLAAAAALAALGLFAVVGALRPRPAETASAAAPVYTVRATTAENEYRLALVRDDAAVREMIRTQNPDGSWKNDFLTRRNAEALKGCASPEARLAYRKAVRNLRTRGLL